jgi:hypothetical protein
LLTKAERAQGFYFKFMAAGLLRGASKERGEYFARALGSGGSTPWMTQDEVRALDELNPFGGDAGVLHQPPVAASPAAPTPDPAAQKSFEVLERSFRTCLHGLHLHARAVDQHHAQSGACHRQSRPVGGDGEPHRRSQGRRARSGTECAR